MKKQLMFRVAVMCVSATIALTAISCNDDDDNVASEIAFDGTKKALTRSYFPVAATNRSIPMEARTINRG